MIFFWPTAFSLLLTIGSHNIALAQDSLAVLRPAIVRYLQPLRQEISGERAYETVRYLQRFWRVGGNRDFNSAMTRIADDLRQEGYDTSLPRFVLQVDHVAVPGDSAWQPHTARLALIAPVDTLLYTLETTPMFLCINSTSTPPDGVVGEIVFIDSLADIQPGGLHRKIAYTHRPVRSVYNAAVTRGEALGIISSYLPDYNQPDKYRNLVSMASIPRARGRSGFGLKVSRNVQNLLDSLLSRGAVQAHVQVAAEFIPKNVTEVTAEIRGIRRHDEAIVLIAHVDEPGANDNASGSGTLLELAVALKRLIDSGTIAPPARTLRFMWVEEIDTIRRRQKLHPQVFTSIMAAIVLDMTGENTLLTGGRFLVEKTPDPSALWTRPPDRHTEWGRSSFPKEWMKGTYLNDLVLAVCDAVAAIEPWEYDTNPFEGGSDHVPFLRAGIPAVLLWHFTDVFYHTSGDDLEKVSVDEMRRVAMVAAVTALLIANLDEEQAIALAYWLAARGRWRLHNAVQNSLLLIASASDTTSVQTELHILSAWMEWYRQALDSLRPLPITSNRERLAAVIAEEKRSIEQLYEHLRNRLSHEGSALQDSRH